MILMQQPGQSSVEALRALAQAGASDHLLGQAVRELLAVAEIQRNAVMPPSPVDVNRPVIPVEHITAPASAPAVASVPKNKQVLVAEPAAKKKPIIIGFRDKAGNRTSVSFTEERWQEMLSDMPDEKKLSALVRQVAPEAPADSNRSTWAYETLLAKFQG